MAVMEFIDKMEMFHFWDSSLKKIWTYPPLILKKVSIPDPLFLLSTRALSSRSSSNGFEWLAIYQLECVSSLRLLGSKLARPQWYWHIICCTWFSLLWLLVRHASQLGYFSSKVDMVVSRSKLFKSSYLALIFQQEASMAHHQLYRVFILKIVKSKWLYMSLGTSTNYCMYLGYQVQGRLSLKNSAGANGGTFFGVQFYCIFVRFGKMTHLVNLKKCRGSSPGCPGLCAAPDQVHCNRFLVSLHFHFSFINTW